MFSSFALTCGAPASEMGHATPSPIPQPPLHPRCCANIRNERSVCTHLVELNPLLVSLGAGVGDPQGSKLGSEQVGGVLLHDGNVEAEYPGGDSLWAVGEVIYR